MSGKRQSLRPLSHVGPWSLEDYRSFRRLCNAALRLERPPPVTDEGLLACMPVPSSFSDVAAAEKALRKHPVYAWLVKRIPLAVNTAGDKTPFIQFRRLRALVAHIPGLLLPMVPVRMDKQRETAAKDIQRVQQSIDSGVLWFENLARLEMLEELLADAMQVLQRPRRRPKSVKHPSLQWLAEQLYEQTRIADVQLLLKVAEACNLDCDERTVQRYAEDAHNT